MGVRNDRYLPPEASVDLGMAYQFTDNLELELAGGTGINHKMTFLTIGLSWRTGEEDE
jgi:outer membrane protein W